eukprot:CAMPEP_0170761360 /NCGR_PEP_ID=MMETSP0733-20121128/2125_1 /TAXON_ID=186038 /ORGANISM="Fragilariopsis kerguelensis, Strain L26-C5" /LENGTH=141 /DNA_ID=CAMNT_0011101329 /DNA_START=46 /DNA_END=471 /DNA_ORIENTATION=-
MTICGASTFCIWPTLGSNKGYVFHSSLFKWIDAAAEHLGNIVVYKSPLLNRCYDPQVLERTPEGKRRPASDFKALGNWEPEILLQFLRQNLTVAFDNLDQTMLFEDMRNSGSVALLNLNATRTSVGSNSSLDVKESRWPSL